MLLLRATVCLARDEETTNRMLTTGSGDVAVALLKEGADHTLKTNEDMTALDLAPDKDVRLLGLYPCIRN